VPGSAEARVALKAARFRTAFVQLRALWGACGTLVTASLFGLCLETGIEADIGACSQRKDKCYDERNHQLSPDALRFRGDQERQEEVSGSPSALSGRPLTVRASTSGSARKLGEDFARPIY
jgi:hypothetical protein